MSSQTFKVTFALDEDDVAYFRGLFRKARKAAAQRDEKEIVGAARELVEKMRRGKKKAPGFVIEAVETLEDLTQVIEDPDWKPPQAVRRQVIGALAYFGDSGDLIPDDIPVLGFLDDALMIKLVEQEFRHELWGYRKFRKFRDGAEQRPWTAIARERLPKRLAAERAKLRKQIEAKKKREARLARLF